jgi:hypothetical protein
MDENGVYVLCDFGSATAKFWNPQKHSVKEIEEELSRYLAVLTNLLPILITVVFSATYKFKNISFL